MGNVYLLREAILWRSRRSYSMMFKNGWARKLVPNGNVGYLCWIRWKYRRSIQLSIHRAPQQNNPPYRHVRFQYKIYPKALQNSVPLSISISPLLILSSLRKEDCNFSPLLVPSDASTSCYCQNVRWISSSTLTGCFRWNLRTVISRIIWNKVSSDMICFRCFISFCLYVLLLIPFILKHLYFGG